MKMLETIIKNLLLVFNPFCGLKIDLKNDHSSWKNAYLNEKITLIFFFKCTISILLTNIMMNGIITRKFTKIHKNS
jgi:hypothetical protein